MQSLTLQVTGGMSVVSVLSLLISCKAICVVEVPFTVRITMFGLCSVTSWPVRQLRVRNVLDTVPLISRLTMVRLVN